MGYRTYFILVREDGEPFTDDMLQAIEALEVFELVTETMAEGYTKWYTCTDDMEEFSKLFPGIVFRLHGDGDGEENDLWDEYYLDGKSQRCDAEIIYPPYDPSKLA
ncbi:MAG TPA: hypothetical protein PLQ71_15870 [Nitrospira sp.]|jgi:hypothetical protein|nr:hypothetical protein [Rhodocyclaceae bacterium]HNG03365.1 hypothetical protein [Nitrospira sp.]